MNTTALRATVRDPIPWVFPLAGVLFAVQIYITGLTVAAAVLDLVWAVGVVAVVVHVYGSHVRAAKVQADREQRARIH